MNGKTEREKRLATALRDNLKRRKAPGPEPRPSESDGGSAKESDQH